MEPALDTYPARIIDALERRCAQVVNAYFASATHLCPAFVTESPHTLKETSVLIPFHGRKIVGRMIVSTHVSVLKAMRVCVLPQQPDPPIEQIYDAAGEVANQLLGQVQKCFGARGMGFRIGLPVVIHSPHGKAVEFRFKAPTPPLVVHLDTPEGDFYVAFSFDQIDESAFEDGGLEDKEVSEDITFF